jgi:hypothetical protein
MINRAEIHQNNNIVSLQKTISLHYIDQPVIVATNKITTTKQTNKLHGLSPRANYTDRATAACRRSECQLFADKGFHVVSVTDPYGRILGYIDQPVTVATKKLTAANILKIFPPFCRIRRFITVLTTARH